MGQWHWPHWGLGGRGELWLLRAWANQRRVFSRAVTWSDLCYQKTDWKMEEGLGGVGRES